MRSRNPAQRPGGLLRRVRTRCAAARLLATDPAPRSTSKWVTKTRGPEWRVAIAAPYAGQASEEAQLN